MYTEKNEFYNIPIDFDSYTKSVNSCDSYYRTGCAYDTESTTISHTEKVKDDDDRTVIDYCFVYHIQFAIGSTYYSFRTFQEFFEWFVYFVNVVKENSLQREEHPKCVIWVANMAHEWAFMKNYICERFRVTRCFSKTKRDVLLLEVESCVQFREGIGLFGHSLADISKNWCTVFTKMTGDLDYNKVRTFMTELTRKEELYCMNDVLVLTEMHDKVFQAYERDNNVIYIPMTSSGFLRIALKERIESDEGLTAERENLGEKWLEKTNVQLLKRRNTKLYTTADDWNLIRSYGFAGGVVGSDIKSVGKVLNNITCADITSDYPYQLLCKKFPNGPIEKRKSKEWEVIKNSDKPWFALLHFDCITSTTQHAVLSKHKVINLNDSSYAEIHGRPRDYIYNNGKILTAKNVIVIMNDVDYKTYSEAYQLDNPVCLKCWVFPWGYHRLPEWLTDCIIKNYIIKAKLKVEIQKYKDADMEVPQDLQVAYMDAKRFVNGLFGCLATRPDDIYNELDTLHLFMPDHEYTFDELKNNTWLNPYWAFYTTSYARQMLIQYIVKYPDAVVQYDTDSLYLKNNKEGKKLKAELTEFNERCIEFNKRRFRALVERDYMYDLGTWDFEKTYDKFMCMGAKKYMKERKGKIETVIAGLPKQAIPKQIHRYHIKHTFEKFNPLLKGADIIIKHMFTGKFASAYNDVCDTKYVPIRDYKGTTALQPVSSFHALIPIDFTLSVADEYLKLARKFQKVKAVH